MRLRYLAAAFGIICLATAAFADGPYRMYIFGDFDQSFIDEAIAKDSTGRLEMIDIHATPGPDTGPEILAYLSQDWAAAAAYFERRNDTYIPSLLEPASDPAVIVRRADYLRENGTPGRLYVFVSYVQGKPVPRDCQVALMARDFATVDPLPAVTLDDCLDGLS